MIRLTLFILLSIHLYASPLQEAIDKASPYSTIKLKAGIYLGSIIINKPLRLIGEEDGVIIDGLNSGNTISVNSSDVCIRNLHIRNSGKQMHTLDSAINIKKAKNIRVTNCKITDSLYGINMYMVEDSIFSDNNITSIKEDLELRGDAFKIWHSHNNIINNNHINRVRDMTLNYSNKNIIKDNTFTNSRFALYLSLSHKSIIKNNIYKYNSVSIMIIGAKDTNISNNKILSSNGAAGIGMLLKGVKNLHVEKNKISFNAIGVYVDSKSTEMGMQRYFNDNNFTYNKEALHFHKDIQNNTITNNIFNANIDDITKNTQNNTTFYNLVKYNYWDRYEGFDKNKDYIGDRPFKMYIYSSKIWQSNPKAKFFYAAPIMSILDFIGELAPFIEPVLILEDNEPLIRYSKNPKDF